MNKNIGFLLLAIYLILVGVNGLVHIGNMGLVLSILALISGIMILLKR